MIEKASEILNAFIEAEKKKIEGKDMPHMPTLGRAYEEILKKGIDADFSIPKKLNLRVVSGFITIKGKTIAKQIDCMLVYGNGEKYGETEEYFYDIENVLCIFEVKKTLDKKGFTSAVNHLSEVREEFQKYLTERLCEGYEPNLKAAQKYYSTLTGEVAPKKLSDALSIEKGKAALFSSLLQETLAPTTIIFGHDGYQTESGLRNAFLKIWEKREKENKSLSPILQPSLVLANDFCLIKGDGVPFQLFTRSQWMVMGSTRYNSIKMLLEIIWGKIEYCFNVAMPWQDELRTDNIARLITAFPEKDKLVCIPHELKEKELKRDDSSLWEPIKINEAEYDYLLVGGFHGYPCKDDRIDSHLINTHKVTLQHVVNNLIGTKYFVSDGRTVSSVGSFRVVKASDGQHYIATSNDDRFDSWAKENNIEKIRTLNFNRALQ